MIDEVGRTASHVFISVDALTTHHVLHMTVDELAVTPVFDHIMRQVLSVSTRRTWCRLVGHKHQIVGAAMVHFVDARQGGQTRAITGDARGDFVIWDVGHGQVRSTKKVDT